MERPLRPLAAVAMGGMAGALTRLALVEATPAEADDFILFGINVAGSFLLGVLIGRRERMAPNRFLAIGTGFAGGLTTFSGYAVAVASDLDRGALLVAAGNGALTPVAALLAAGFGFRSSRLLGASPRRRRPGPSSRRSVVGQGGGRPA